MMVLATFATMWPNVAKIIKMRVVDLVLEYIMVYSTSFTIILGQNLARFLNVHCGQLVSVKEF